ncbi:MAG: methyltransferase domain-containing protein, partial [Planctomycetaceae bacterium]|nr:methyltransferase domain-containing protein [Planctomycetaceae bacterium]
GSAYGHEFQPISKRLQKITILEPSEAFSGRLEINGTPLEFVKPSPSGVLPFPDGKFSLTTCFGVLHHIPNVSFVIGEIARCTSDNGLFILREPIVSMGDWRYSRPGLTKRERGIPLALLHQFLRDAGFQIEQQKLFGFRPFIRLMCSMGRRPYSSELMTRADILLANFFAWNLRYHRTKFFHRLAPTSAYIVARRFA